MQNFFYIGYLLSDAGAPHQAMAALYLAKQGHRVVFFAWGNTKPPDWLAEYPSLEYQLIPKKGLLSALKYLLYLFQSFFQYRSDIDVVYVQGAQQTPFLFWLPWVKGKCKSVYHTQDYLEPGRHPFYERFERFFARRADWVISNEPNRARFMASNYCLKQMPEVIRTALPSWWLVPERDYTYRNHLLAIASLDHVDNPRLIVAGGSYSSERMSPQVLDALAQLPDNYALIFTGMISGKEEYTTYQSHLKQHEISKRVIEFEYLGYENLLRLYAASDIGVLLYPNSGVGHFYQAPGRLTEYLSAGLAIITSNFPGLELLTLKYDLGLSVSPYDSMLIARAIDDLGKQSNCQLAEKRTHFIEIARSSLSYEVQADVVFHRILNYS